MNEKTQTHLPRRTMKPFEKMEGNDKMESVKD